MKKVCTLCGCSSYEAFAFKKLLCVKTCLRHLEVGFADIWPGANSIISLTDSDSPDFFRGAV